MHPKHSVDIVVGVALLVTLAGGLLGVYERAFSETADHSIAISWTSIFLAYAIGRMVGEIR